MRPPAKRRTARPASRRRAKPVAQERRTSRAQDLEHEVDTRLLLAVLNEIGRGNFSARMPVGMRGVPGQVAAKLNALIDRDELNVRHLARVSRVIDAVADGDLSETMELELEGRPLEGQYLRMAKTVNSTVKRSPLSSVRNGHTLPCRSRAGTLAPPSEWTSTAVTCPAKPGRTTRASASSAAACRWAPPRPR